MTASESSHAQSEGYPACQIRATVVRGYWNEVGIMKRELILGCLSNLSTFTCTCRSLASVLSRLCSPPNPCCILCQTDKPFLLLQSRLCQLHHHPIQLYVMHLQLSTVITGHRLVNLYGQISIIYMI